MLLHSSEDASPQVKYSVRDFVVFVAWFFLCSAAACVAAWTVIGPGQETLLQRAVATLFVAAYRSCINSR